MSQPPVLPYPVQPQPAPPDPVAGGAQAEPVFGGAEHPQRLPEVVPGPGPGPGRPAHRRSETGRLVAVVLAAVVLVCAVSATAAYLVTRDSGKTAVATAHTRLVAPGTLAGRARVNQPSIQAGIDAAVAELKGQHGITSVVGGAYGDLAKRDLVIVVAAAQAIADPTRALDPFIAGMSRAGVRVTGLTAVSPGPLGGVAKCGDTTVSGIAAGICAWADRASTGSVVIYFANAAAAKAEFVRIRGAVELRT
jgi:hypothetical protein